MNTLKLNMVALLFMATFELKQDFISTAKDFFKSLIGDKLFMSACCGEKVSEDVEVCEDFQVGWTCDMFWAYACEIEDIPPTKDDPDNPDTACIISEDITMKPRRLFHRMGGKPSFTKYADTLDENGNTVGRQFIFRVEGQRPQLERIKSELKKDGIVIIAKDCSGYNWLHGSNEKPGTITFSSEHDATNNYTEFTLSWNDCKRFVYEGTVPA